MRPRKPVLVADLIARFLARRHGHPSREKEALALKVFAAFSRIGPPVTDHVEPAFLKHGILTLTVQESAWLTELTFLKPQILERINKALQRPVVQDLRMRLGALTPRPAKTLPSEPKLTFAQKERVAEWGASIARADVREAVMRAAARSIAEPRRAQRTIATVPGPRPPAPPVEPPTKDKWANVDHWKRK
jgi:hypothetical protein